MTTNADLLSSLDLEHLAPLGIWHHLVPETRALAVKALYARSGSDDRTFEALANAAIAKALRFRDASVVKMPLEKKAHYLSRGVPINDHLAFGLLQSLHFAERRALLKTFLDALGVPHEDGIIKDDAQLDPPKPEVLAAAVDKLYASHDAPEADLYLACMLAFDPEHWSGLKALLAARATKPSA